MKSHPTFDSKRPTISLTLHAISSGKTPRTKPRCGWLGTLLSFRKLPAPKIVLLNKTPLLCVGLLFITTHTTLGTDNQQAIKELLDSAGRVVTSRDVSPDRGYFIVAPKNGIGRISIFFQKYPEPKASEKAYIEIASGVSQGVREPPFKVGEAMSWASMGSTWSVVAKFENTVLSMSGIDGVSPEFAKQLAISFSRVFASKEWTN